MPLNITLVIGRLAILDFWVVLMKMSYSANVTDCESSGRVEGVLSLITNGRIVELVIYDLMAGNGVL